MLGFHVTEFGAQCNFYLVIFVATKMPRIFYVKAIYAARSAHPCKQFPICSPHVMLRYKFDDERVTKEDAKKALEEQYGGEEEVSYI